MADSSDVIKSNKPISKKEHIINVVSEIKEKHKGLDNYNITFLFDMNNDDDIPKDLIEKLGATVKDINEFKKDK